MLTLSLTPKAESDLVEIWVYTCDEWDLDQADTYLDQLEEGMKQLIHHPSLGTDYVCPRQIPVMSKSRAEIISTLFEERSATGTPSSFFGMPAS